MTDKFDNGTNNKNDMKSDRPGSRTENWDDFLSDFKNEDDIEVHSLEDLGIDDDFDLSELQNSSDVTTATIKVPLPNDRKGSARRGQRDSGQRADQNHEQTDTSETETHSSDELDLSIFDELDELDVLLDRDPFATDSGASGTSSDPENASSSGFSEEHIETASDTREKEISEDFSDAQEKENPEDSSASQAKDPQQEKRDDKLSADAQTEQPSEGFADTPSSETPAASPSDNSSEKTPSDASAPESDDVDNALITADSENDLQQATAENTQDGKDMDKEKTPKKKKTRREKKQKPLWRRIVKWIVLALIACVIAGIAYTAFIICTTPEIDPDNIYEELNQTSVIHDDTGEILEYVATAEIRTNVTYDQMPQNLINAFVAIEDKTFFEHNGFNFVRILGAIKESIFSNKDVSGTSTITQQLARNLYLTKDRTMTRKIREAYYTIILEKNLTKEQIIEAYLNTISLGFGSLGVQAASEAYFGCDVSELTIAQCATLASIPKSPAKYSPLKNYYNDDVSADSENILLIGDTYTTVYDDTFLERQRLVLKFMNEQGKISDEEYQAALAEDIKASLHPTEDKQIVSSYFADYCLREVKDDLMKEFNLTEDGATDLVNHGLHIYSTLDVEMQQIAEAEFSKNSNFPHIARMNTDKNGNVLDANKNIAMYKRGTYFDADGSFTLRSGEFDFDADGNLVIYAGQRLRFYTVKGSGDTKEEQIEFKKIYYTEKGILYNINGGVIGAGIEAKYKSKDSDGNVVISKEFLDSDKNIFIIGDGTVTVTPEHYTLRQETIQPQGSMVVTDFATGQIKVMVGGRSLKGRLLYNRADNPRQPGSSIKPIAVYGPAIQSGVDLGTGWTAGSTIEDSPNYVNGKLWPKNWYSQYKGWITLRTCVEQSVNIPSVRLLQNIGESYAIEYLKKNGVTTVVEDGDPNDKNPAALALGGMTKGISPIEMASAYGTFPNGGVHVEPTTYTKVTDYQGNVLLEKEPEETRVYDEGVAFIMTDILRTTVSNGIAGRAAIGVAPVGGKTGTTTDNYDAWFVGFTPQYSASVWIGNDVNVELSQGSAAAATLWSKVMRQIAPKATTTSFRSRPDNVYVSGGEYFVEGTSRTGRPVSPYEEEPEDEEVLYDENGQPYILDPDTGEKIPVSVDPATGKITRLPSTDTPDDPATDPNTDPNNTTDPNNNQNPSGPNVDPTPTPTPDPTPTPTPDPDPTPVDPTPDPNPPGVIDDRRR